MRAQVDFCHHWRDRAKEDTMSAQRPSGIIVAALLGLLVALVATHGPVVAEQGSVLMEDPFADIDLQTLEAKPSTGPAAAPTRPAPPSPPTTSSPPPPPPPPPPLPPPTADTPFRPAPPEARDTEQSGCRVMDPTGTLLNVRTGPNARIVGTVPNGLRVSILSMARDNRGRLWVEIANYDSGLYLGWVFRNFIACR